MKFQMTIYGDVDLSHEDVCEFAKVVSKMATYFGDNISVLAESNTNNGGDDSDYAEGYGWTSTRI